MIQVIESFEAVGARRDFFSLVEDDWEAVRTLVRMGNVLLRRNLFADEEVPSDYIYPEGYCVKPILEQIEMLADVLKLQPTESLVYVKNLPRLPDGAEGWFAIASWHAVAENYSTAVVKLFEIMDRLRNLEMTPGSWTNEKYFRQLPETQRAMAEICKQQSGDIIIIPAQFGLRHRGRSSCRAQTSFAVNEFGLGAFVSGCMLLTHPEREQTLEQLHVLCAGDKYTRLCDEKFDHVPIIGYGDEKNQAYYSARAENNSSDMLGAVTGFIS